MVANWSLEIEGMSWVEHTAEEVDFVIAALGLHGGERVLDLACGFGRHALELAQRGYAVVGIDFTEDYIARARFLAQERNLNNVEFGLADVRQVDYREAFDVVLNMADGAIGYFETEEDNLRLFDVIADALKPGGKHVMGICSAAHAAKHFPRRHWEAEPQPVTGRLPLGPIHTADGLPRSRAHLWRTAHALERRLSRGQSGWHPALLARGTRHQSSRSAACGSLAAYGGYTTSIPASADHLMQVVCSVKERDCGSLR